MRNLPVLSQMSSSAPSTRKMTPTAHLPLPRELYIESTNRCNELCDQCPRTHLGREEQADISLAQVIAITDQFPVLDRVVLHGLGEPMLNLQLPEIVAHLRQRGTYVLFNSNATALSERLGRALISAGLNEIRVSLDGASAPMYARVRGVSERTLPKIIRNLSAFTRLQRELGATHPHLSFWFTAMRENLHELPGLVNLALETGVREIYVQRFVYFGEGLATEDQALYRRTREKDQAIIDETARLCAQHGLAFRATGATSPAEYISSTAATEARLWSGCARPRTLAYITAQGNVFSCCFAPFSRGPASSRVLGNVFEQPFAEIWNGPRYTAFRAAFDSDHPWEQCKGCGTNWSL